MKSVRARRTSDVSPRLSLVYGSPLPAYDVRVRRELAHRRLVVSLFRRFLRIATLHLSDAVALAMAMVFASWLAGAREVLQPTTMLALGAYVLIALNVRGAYGPGPARRDSARLVTATIGGTVLAWIGASLIGSAPVSQQFLSFFALAASATLIISRHVVDAIVRLAYARGIGLRRAILVCNTREAAEIIDGLSVSSQAGTVDVSEDQVIIGYVATDDPRDPTPRGTMARLRDVIEAHDVSELVVATSVRRAALIEIAEACFEAGIRVFAIAPAAHTLGLWAESTKVGRWPAHHLHPTRFEVPTLVLKRAFDVVFAGIALVASFPVALVIALAIKIETRGPVFFRQRRVGLGGREFMMWKFRSMAHEAEQKQAEIAHLNSYSDGKLFKLPGDPRITRVGAFLRRFSLDELPQLLNVLAGDMSLVGPRPPLPSEVQTYEARHLVRLSVVPGMTGPWQVNGRNLITDFEEVVRLERAYIETWSLRSDVEILLRTLGVVLSGKGAY